MLKTVDEINEKVKAGKAKVLTAIEAKDFIKDKGIKSLAENVDIVTFASFEMHVNSALYLSFGQTDPLIYFSEAFINNVLALPAGPTDLILSVISSSKENLEYGGGHVIEELVAGKDLHLKSSGKNLEVFINKEFETWFNQKDLNSAKLFLNQAITQNNVVATNSGNKDINSHMGTLIAHIENSTFNSSSFLNPHINDPFSNVLGMGSKVWVSGAQGVITGHGSHHNPKQKRNEHGIPVATGITLSVVADIASMNPKWVRGGYIKSFGPVLYVGIGVPIPVLNEEVAKNISITDDKIHSTIVDFSIPRRSKPTFGQCVYSELRTSTVSINKKPTLVAPLSSMAFAIEICNLLKNSILNREFYLNEKISPVDLNMDLKKLDSRLKEMV